MITIGRFPTTPPEPPPARPHEPLSVPVPTPFDRELDAFKASGGGTPAARAALLADGREFVGTWAAQLERAGFAPAALIALLREMGGERARFVVGGIVTLRSGRKISLKEISHEP